MRNYQTARRISAKVIAMNLLFPSRKAIRDWKNPQSSGAYGTLSGKIGAKIKNFFLF